MLVQNLIIKQKNQNLKNSQVKYKLHHQYNQSIKEIKKGKQLRLKQIEVGQQKHTRLQKSFQITIQHKRFLFLCLKGNLNQWNLKDSKL